MAIGPRASDLPRIRTALAWYRVSAAITGVFLVGLVVMMIVRYGYGSDLALNGPDGFISLLPHVADPDLEPEKALWWSAGVVNLSTIILIVHGWFYVLYLFIDFVLWRLVRYSFGYFLLVALGGVVPFLSFYFEWRVPRDIHTRIAALETQEVSA